MSMNILERKKIVVDEDFAVLEHEVLKQAERELGYQVAAAQHDRLTRTQKIAKALDAAGVQPFTPESVRRYQGKMRRKGAWKQLFVGMGISLVAFALSFPALMNEIEWLAVCSGVAAVVIGILGMSIMGTSFQDLPQWRRERLAADTSSWRATRQDVYRGTIPIFVLLTAMNVLKELRAEGLAVDQSNLSIERLRSREEMREERQFQEMLDPFLVLTGLDGNDYYLEVWDEPGFERPTRKV